MSKVLEFAAPDWASLIERIQAGDEDAVAELHRTLVQRGFLRSVLQRRAVYPADLDDLTQEAFIHVFRAIEAGQLREPERLLAYARVTAERCASAYIRDAARRRTKLDGNLEHENLVPCHQANAELALQARELSEAVREEVEHLPAKLREVVRRFYLEEQSIAEISAALGLAIGDVKCRLWRARQRLRPWAQRHGVKRAA